MENRVWKVLKILACVAILASALPARAGTVENRVTVRIDIGEFRIAGAAGEQRVFLEDFGRIGEAGKPMLPGRIFAVAVPPDALISSVTVEADEVVELEGIYRLEATPLARVIGVEDPLIRARQVAEWQAVRFASYGSDELYPARFGSFVQRAGLRRYELVDVRVTPFRYRPQSGRLEYAPSLVITIDYTAPESPVPVIGDDLAVLERSAQEIICNIDEARSWYPEAPPRVPEDSFDFVIITSESLIDAVASLVVHEQAKGRTPKVVTVEWIGMTYLGYDLAARIRSFLRAKYPSEVWGIRDVLLVGHPSTVPMRECWLDLGYGRAFTDFYYAELSEADRDSWDLNGNHLYAEEPYDVIDYYTEVNVGRIPWDEPATVYQICQKSAAYELNDDPAFKKNIMVAGSYFWEDTDTAVLMEAKLAQPWMADWTVTRMYEDNADFKSSYSCDMAMNHTNVTTSWSSGSYAFVNWAGHGAPTSSHILGEGSPAFIQVSDTAMLNDAYPSIVWADSCSNANPAYSNLGRAMIGQGAVGFVGASQVAYGCPGWTGPEDGSSQSCDYWFTVKVTSDEMTQGEAHQWALRKLYTDGLWSWLRYEMVEWTLLGNPNLGMSPFAGPDAIFADGFESGDTTGWDVSVE